MWKKPWTLKEGFVICLGLVVAGLLLELVVGPIDWDAFAWPVNGMVLIGFLVIVLGLYFSRKKVYAFRFLSTYHAAIPSMVFAVILTIVMGLTRQMENGVWLNNMLSFWPLVFIYVYMAIILGLVVCKQLAARTFLKSLFSCNALFFHLGLFMTMITATLGNADIQRLMMITEIGETEWRGIDKGQSVVELPLAIELKQFIMEVYDDGSPKRFASEIQVLTKSGKNITTTVDVNKPVEVEEWKIYQYGYDTEKGALSNISILELVRDPWLVYVYIGIGMMLLGAFGMLFTGVRRKK